MAHSTRSPPALRPLALREAGRPDSPSVDTPSPMASGSASSTALAALCADAATAAAWLARMEAAAAARLCSRSPSPASSCSSEMELCFPDSPTSGLRAATPPGVDRAAPRGDGGGACSGSLAGGLPPPAFVMLGLLSR
ncbi:hypothetical protein HT031_003253 [Scenedesmus sp. PABB004]|nr:hypothetical protein HT031_003253 [Scenedesmus sp. PABB004]